MKTENRCYGNKLYNKEFIIFLGIFELILLTNNDQIIKSIGEK